MRGPHGRLSSALPRGGGEQGGGGIGVVGRGLGFHVAKTCLSGRGLRAGERSCARPTSSPPPLEAASRQREEVSSAYMKVCEMVMGILS